MESASSSRSSLAARWKGLSSVNRRRIVIGSLFALALAARDLMLLGVAGGMLALSEMGAAPRAQASAA